MIGAESPDRIGDGLERIVTAHLPLGPGPDFFELTEDGLPSLICLLAGPIGSRREPLEPARQGRGNHKDLLGSVDQLANAEGEHFDVSRDLASRD
jgi:hypothetical protein